MQSFKHFLLQLDESSTVDNAKRKLKKMKGQQVSFTDQRSSKKVTGIYQGMKRMGGRTYAHVETGKQAYHVPPHQIDQVQESVNEDSSLTEAKHSRKQMVSWVGDKMENSDMDIDQMRDAFVKKFGRDAVDDFEQIVDELND